MSSLSLILLLPLLGFAINGVFGKSLPKNIVGWLGTFAVLVPFIIAIQGFFHLQHGGTNLVWKALTFLNIEGLTFDASFTLDRLSVIMTLVITGIGTLIHIYSIAYMHEDEGFYKFFAYLNLFIFNMLILVLGSNFLMLFFGWEGVGLCSYLLIGFWYKNLEYGKAARKAFIMNRIGDLGLLLGLFLIVAQFNSLDYSTVFGKIGQGGVSPHIITTIAILLFIGAMGKSAQIPLYTWLPDAMAGPTPVSALIHAATMVTAGIYLIVRSEVLFASSLIANEFIGWIGLATSLLAAFIGLKQNDIKKVLAYSTVSQLGLMFVALSCHAYSAAMFHLITHAFFKALLFLGSGSVIHAMHHEQDIRKMGGLKSKLPITYWTFLIGTLAITGFPFLSGFFSKDEILLHLYSHNTVMYGLAAFSAVLTGLYMFRMFFVTFHGNYRNTHHEFSKVHESPALMTTPLLILAILSVIGGLINLPEYFGESASQSLEKWLEPILPIQESILEIGHTTEIMLLTVAVLIFTVAFLVTRIKYVSKSNIPEADENIPNSAKLFSNKFYVDEIFNALIVKPIEFFGNILDSLIDNKFIGGIVESFSVILAKISSFNKRIQNGNIEFYLVFMVIGLALFLGLNLFF